MFQIKPHKATEVFKVEGWSEERRKGKRGRNRIGFVKFHVY